MESPSDVQAGGQRLQILVVDDEANIRRTLAVCLETEGHHVVGVSNVVRRSPCSVSVRRGNMLLVVMKPFTPGRA